MPDWKSEIRARLAALNLDAVREFEIVEEISQHLDDRFAELHNDGASAAEARRLVLAELIDGKLLETELQRIERSARPEPVVLGQTKGNMLEGFFADLKYGARMLSRNPGFTAVAVLTLALGIGANTAMFSVVNAVLLRPLVYPESGQLVSLCERGPDWSGGSIAYPNFIDWKNQQSVFESFGVYNGGSFTLTGAGEPVRVVGALVSADVFAALRTKPEIGRVFREDEDKPDAPPVAVISHALWKNRLGGRAEIVNTTINLNGKPYTVLGVMPAGFEFPNRVDLWVEVGPYFADSTWQKRDYHPGLFGLARLKSGVTLDKARADLNAVALRLEQQYPESNKTRGVQIDSLLDKTIGNVGRALWILLGAVSFVLVIACANVANLLLARAAAREKEMALRAALGAGQLRITRQLLTESGLLALMGALGGLLFANAALRVVVNLAGENVPRAMEASLDLRVLLFSGVVAVVTGVLFGLAPAWHARRLNLQGTLKEAGRGVTSGRRALRQGLVIAEVALTFVLLVGAGLLFVSLHRLLQVNPGFVVDRVLTFHVDLPDYKYQTGDQQVLFYRGLLEKLRASPGIRAASLVSQIPLDQGGWDMHFVIEGRPEPPSHLQPDLQVTLVAPDYFQAMGIPLLQGRDFTDQDNRDHLRGASSGKDWGAGLNSIIIDEEFAKRYWPGQSPLGQRIRLPWGERGKQPIMTVVGVVGRVKKNRLSDQGGMVQSYMPFLQQPIPAMAVVVKTTADPAATLAAVRRQVSELDPALPIFGITTMKEMRDDNVAPDRLNLSLLAGFAVLALVLAVIGLYGLLSFMVTQRHREIGVRMALGAQRFDILHLVVGQGMRLVLIGAFIGVVGSVALTRVLTGVLFNVAPTDPLTLFAVTLSLCLAALLACYIPALRATKIHPTEALRCE